VKKGKLKVHDTFVCGLHEGKIKYMKDDNQKIINEAFPG
jgi:translation initiation factor IF-2